MRKKDYLTNISIDKMLFSISQASKQLNVHPQTLRNWERKELIKPIRIGGRRLYSMAAIERCREIKKYTDKGLSLKAATRFLSKPKRGEKVLSAKGN